MRLPRPLLSALACAGLWPASAPAAGWTQFGADAGRTGLSPFDTVLTPAGAAGLHEVWSVRLGDVLNAQPAVSDGPNPVAVAASENGTVAAIDVTTGAVRWRRRLPSQKTTCGDLPGGRYGISTTPLLSRGRAYVVAADGRAYALSLASGRTMSGWPVRVLRDPVREHVWGALALWRGRLYVPAASACDNRYYHGEVVALSVARRRRVARWSAIPRGHGGGVWAWGGVAVDATRGRIYAATANAQGRGGETHGYGEQVVALTRGLRLAASDHPSVPNDADSDFGGHPVLVDAGGCPPLLAVMHKSGALLLYDRRHLGRGPLQRMATADPRFNSAFGTYAWSAAQRTLYLANSSDGRLRHGLDALRLGSDCRLHVRWELAAEPSPYAPGSPSLTAGGLVVWGAGTSGRVDVADAQTGRLLRTLGPLAGPVVGGVSVGAGTILVPAWDGRVHAFAATL